MFKKVKAAAISFIPKKMNLAANADKLEKAFRTAAEEGAELAVAPEGILEGYVVNEIITGGLRAQRMLDAAVTMRSSYIKRFRGLARELKMCLAFGLAERIGHEVYNCAVFLDQTGRLRGRYHKMQLAEGYHDSWWFNRLGEKSRAFETPFGRCGFLICNDRWNADIARIPVLDGAQYLLIPSYGSTARAQDAAVLSRARENGVPIVEANVGRTMIISKGEIVGSSSKQTAITTSVIEIPALRSKENRDRQEQVFLHWRTREMPERYRKNMENIKEKKKKTKNAGTIKTHHDEKGAIIDIEDK